MHGLAKYPYTGYRLYVVLHKGEGRRMANLVRFCSRERTTISYARYLMSVYLGRFLTLDEHVDHINGDKLDDRIDNYQIMSASNNNKKHRLDNPSVLIELVCPICGVSFTRDRQGAYKFIKFGLQQCCSVICGRVKAKLTAANNR